MLLGPVLPGEEESPAVSPGTLARLSEASLKRALDHPGRDRQGAFDLLVGDAFITYACELLAREENPGEGMEELLGTLGKRFSP
jgi:hypothetical protein